MRSRTIREFRTLFRNQRIGVKRKVALVKEIENRLFEDIGEDITSRQRKRTELLVQILFEVAQTQTADVELRGAAVVLLSALYLDLFQNQRHRLYVLAERWLSSSLLSPEQKRALRMVISVHGRYDVPVCIRTVGCGDERVAVWRNPIDQYR